MLKIPANKTVFLNDEVKKRETLNQNLYKKGGRSSKKLKVIH